MVEETTVAWLSFGLIAASALLDVFEPSCAVNSHALISLLNAMGIFCAVSWALIVLVFWVKEKITRRPE